eukprot:Gregarina_sp_Poly_1__2129@NODE_1564_length_3841_cov_141_446741_g1031_i0_p1_GENE_NODE_1564_length_3841_cov_141_446741_g1031_i0NODE_1564_length_3841_cov_141_446741_g1031_i0_p1_ORF_typecomplete_len432_score58_12HSP70/PF00012_20/2_6e23MreB_Mbl/PF06723_13/4_6e08StbA/PF06406_11/6_8e03StbA/PF06406_11/0_00069PilM_2/PF11104_8/1_2e03PilM_2/PF11104_8/0_002Peptidase_M22/PF00814_25/0_034LpxI_N/PF17930_1/0_14FGGY_C/PF02782_16/0_25TUDOR/PF00567_24/0_23Actin/PF00022_19/0_14_NODE_1564_length_3841_cov_141_446741_
MSSSPKFVGVDFGASQYCLAKIEGEQAAIIQNDLCERITPSYVLLEGHREGELGGQARLRYAQNVDTSVVNLKCHLSSNQGTENRKKIQEALEVTLKQLYSFVRISDPFQKFKFAIAVPPDSRLKTELISAQERSRNAEVEAENPIPECVCIDELDALCRCYYFLLSQNNRKRSGAWNVLFIDYGGASLKAALVKCTGDSCKDLYRRSIDYVGGEFLDAAIVAWLQEKHNCPVDVSDKGTYQELKMKCTKAREALSDIKMASIEFKANKYIITYDDFKAIYEKECGEKISRAMQIFRDQKIDEVVVVGGCSRTRCFREFLETTLENANFCGLLNPLECIAIGAALKDSKLVPQTMKRMQPEAVEEKNGSGTAFTAVSGLDFKNRYRGLPSQRQETTCRDCLFCPFRWAWACLQSMWEILLACLRRRTRQRS